MAGSGIGDNLVGDMLSLLHEDWVPDEKKDIIKLILLSAVDNMYDFVQELEKHK